MKRFVKDEGHADSYDGLTIDYVRGKPPHLIMLDGEVEVERIDLKDYTTDGLHELMREKGFERRADAAPIPASEPIPDPVAERRKKNDARRAAAAAAAEAVADAETAL